MRRAEPTAMVFAASVAAGLARRRLAPERFAELERASSRSRSCGSPR